MKLIALDLGNRSGFACGDSRGPKPRIESWLLKRLGQPVEVAVRNLACSLRDNIRREEPEAIVCEMWMHPAAQPGADVIITHQQLHGAVEAIAGCYGIRVERPTSAQFRKHFCGQASAAARRRPGALKTGREKERDRRETNDMVVKRAILLGYLPAGSTDWDKASAAGLYDWGCVYLARTPPRELVMFGERRREEVTP